MSGEWTKIKQEWPRDPSSDATGRRITTLEATPAWPQFMVQSGKLAAAEDTRTSHEQDGRTPTSLSGGPGVLCAAGCSRAGGATEGPRPCGPSSSQWPPATHPRPARPLDAAGRLEALRLGGQFDEFVDEALRSRRSSARATWPCNWKNAKPCWPSAATPTPSSRPRRPPRWPTTPTTGMAAQALKLWTTARFRQGRSLDDLAVGNVLAALPADEPAGEMAPLLA